MRIPSACRPRSPALTSSCPSASSTPSGFSLNVAFPASSAVRLTAECASGGVRFTTASISGSASTASSEHGTRAELRSQRFGAGRILVDARRELDEAQLRDRVRVRAADHAATDDRDATHAFPREWPLPTR